MLEVRTGGPLPQRVPKLARSVRKGAASQNRRGDRQTRRWRKRDRQIRNKGIREESSRWESQQERKQHYNINLAGDPQCMTIQMGKMKFRTLCDTGAQVSLISEKTLQKFHPQPKVRKTTISLHSVSGDSLNVRGTVQLDFTIGGKKFSHTFVVVKGLDRSFILGIDFFTAHQVRIYFDLRQVRVGKVYVPLEQDIHIASLVRSCSTIVLKPKTAVQLWVKRKEGPYFKEGQELELSSAEKGFMASQPEVMLATTVVKNTKEGRFPALLINDSHKTVRIKRGWVIGQLASIDSVQECNIGSVTQSGGSKPPAGKVDLEDLDAPEEYKQQVSQLIQDNSHLFARSDMDLGRTDTVQCHIDTADHPPIKTRPYRTPLQDREVVSKAIDDMLEAKIIRRSQSPWSFGLVVVGKKDGSKRICVDYRKLNEITKKNSYPLPLIDDLLSILGEAKVFTSLDLKSGYWQVSVAEEDREKTAFSCFRGAYEFCQMPFGLTSAPSVFMMLMSTVLSGLEGFAVAYLDDVLIFSKSVEEHWDHVRTVFKRLEEHNLKLKLKKCQFMRKEINYLGFVVGQEGVQPDPEKVRAIRSMPPPTNVREVRSLMGMMSYYRRFMPNFSRIAQPLVELTKKYARFNWTKECQVAFEFLKESLTAVPLLAYPDTRLPYVLYTDASDTCIGACLTQEKKVEGSEESIETPIYFLSHKLSSSQVKWSVIEKEAFAIHYALQKLDHYLHNARFEIRTDHQPLKYLLGSTIANKKIQMWALGISGFDCSISYIQGRKNVLADLLSRMPEGYQEKPGESEVEPRDVNDNAFEIGVINSTGAPTGKFAGYKEERGPNEKLEEIGLKPYDMKVEQGKDPELVTIMTQMKQEDGPKMIKKRYMMIGDVLYFLSHQDDEPQARLVIPSHLREEIVKAYHDNLGHGGLDRTYANIQEKYFWPDLYRGLYEYVSKCVVCQTRVLKGQPAPIQEMDIPPYPFAKVSLDLSGPYPRTLSGNRYIVTFVDHYSGWPEAFAVPDKSANTVVQLLTEEIIPRHSCPLQLVTDNGTENENQVMRETLRTMNIDHVRTSFYHPASNSKVERSHRVLHDVIAKMAQENTQMWDLYLNQALSAIRVSVSETTKHSPFFLLYNRDPVLPIDNILQPRRKYVGEELHKVILENQHKMFTRVHGRIKSAQAKRRQVINEKRQPVTFEVGDAVYVRNHQRKSKFDQKWKPYYRVTKQLSPATFMVRNQLDGTERRIHAEHMSKAKIEEWAIPPPKEGKRPLRGTRLAAKPIRTPSSSDLSEEGEQSSQEEEERPTKRIKRFLQRERSGSSSEEDIPLAELRRRLRVKEQGKVEQVEVGSQTEVEKATPDLRESPEAEVASGNEVTGKTQASVLSFGESAQGQSVKALLEAITGLL